MTRLLLICGAFLVSSPIATFGQDPATLEDLPVLAGRAEVIVRGTVTKHFDGSECDGPKGVAVEVSEIYRDGGQEISRSLRIDVSRGWGYANDKEWRWFRDGEEYLFFLYGDALVPWGKSRISALPGKRIDAFVQGLKRNEEEGWIEIEGRREYPDTPELRRRIARLVSEFTGKDETRRKSSEEEIVRIGRPAVPEIAEVAEIAEASTTIRRLHDRILRVAADRFMASYARSVLNRKPEDYRFGESHRYVKGAKKPSHWCDIGADELWCDAVEFIYQNPYAPKDDRMGIMLVPTTGLPIARGPLRNIGR